MFDNFRKEETHLDDAITKAFDALQNLDITDPNYKKIVNRITELYALKRKPVDIDPNKLIAVFANMAVVVAVLRYEKTGVITTKVGSFIMKQF